MFFKAKSRSRNSQAAFLDPLVIARLSLIGIVFCLNTLIDLFAVNSDFFGCIYTDPHLVSLYSKHSDGYFVTNHQSLAYAAR